MFQVGPHNITATAVAWSDDGLHIAVGTVDGDCQIWDWQRSQRLLNERIDSTRIQDLVWSADDLRVASGSQDGQVCLWDVQTGFQVGVLGSFGIEVCQISWSPDGHKLAAISRDGVIQVWDASSGYELPQSTAWQPLTASLESTEFRRLIEDRQWSDAAELLKRMHASGDHDVRVTSRLALIQLLRGHNQDYRQICQQMLNANTKSASRTDAYLTAWTCAWQPGALPNYSAAVLLAQHAFDSAIDGVSAPYRASEPEALGALLYGCRKVRSGLSPSKRGTCGFIEGLTSVATNRKSACGG